MGGQCIPLILAPTLAERTKLVSARIPWVGNASL